MPQKTGGKDRLNMSDEKELRPQAPKDPKAERGKLYLLLDSLIEGKPDDAEAEGGSRRYKDLYFLGGRVEAKLMNILPELDRQIAADLQTCGGFCAMVEEVGVSALGTEDSWREMTAGFALSGGGGKLHLSAEVPCNGQEVRIPVDTDVRDGVLEVAATSFPIYMMARMTITLYLKPGIAVPELKAEEKPDFTSEAYRKMLDASVISRGNLARLKKAAKKALAGEEVTVAFIGGSITQGAAAKPIGTECYAYLAYEAFCRRFAKAWKTPGDDAGASAGKTEKTLCPQVRFVKAGVGGTSSEFGVCRYERDVLRSGSVAPDILVIEFAVNDMGDETEGEAFESLIAKAQEGPGNPAVIIMFSVFMDDWNLEDRLVPIGELYDLPMVSVKRAVVEQFYRDRPVISKRQYFYDLYHPTNEGHRIMADCLDRIFALAESELAEGTAAGADDSRKSVDTAEGNAPVMDANKKSGEYSLPESVLSRPSRWLKNVKTFSRNQLSACRDVIGFSEGGFTQIDTILHVVQKDELPGAFPEFEDNWMFAGGEPMRFTIRAKDILLIFKDDADERFGHASVLVDGKKTREIDPREVGWVHCNVAIVYRSDTCEEHSVEVCVEEGKTFTVLGISYTTE